MYRKKITYFLFCSCFLFVKCTNTSFFSKKNRKEIALDTIIDFSSIDAYPLFPECDTITLRKTQAVCFKKKLVAMIEKTIKKETFTMQQKIKDTVFLYVKISNTGNFVFDSLTYKDPCAPFSKKLDSLFKEEIPKYPKITPAVKQSFLVASKFTIPIVINN